MISSKSIRQQKGNPRSKYGSGRDDHTQLRQIQAHLLHAHNLPYASDRVKLGQLSITNRSDIVAFKEKWDQAKKDGNSLAAGGVWINDRKYFHRLIGVSARTTLWTPLRKDPRFDKLFAELAPRD